MREIRRKAFSILLVAAVIGPAAAQKADPFDALVADIRIMQDRKVQTDMKVTEAQRNKMNAFSKQHTDRLLAYQKSIKNKKPTAENKKQVELQIVKYLQQLKTNILGVLSPSQVKRLREITLQGYGWSAVADDRVGKKIGMSAAQIQKVKSILSTAARKSATIEETAAKPILAPYKDKKPKNDAEAKKWDDQIKAKMQQAGAKIRPQIIAIQQKAVKDIQGTLTAKQRAAYLALQGKKFSGK